MIVLTASILTENTLVPRHHKRHYFSKTLRSEFLSMYRNPFNIFSEFKFTPSNATIEKHTNDSSTDLKNPESSFANATNSEKTILTLLTVNQTQSQEPIRTEFFNNTRNVFKQTIKGNMQSILNMAGPVHNILKPNRSEFRETLQNGLIGSLFNELSLQNWFKVRASSDNNTTNLDGVTSTAAAAVSKTMTINEMFQIKTSWIIGLAVIATVIGVFFLGCVVVICYTRRPYRRCGKVYEIETASKKNHKIPKVPTVHPTIKTATLTRSKEVFY